MTDRDFKGIWIPKEIWLNDSLTMLDKIVLIEIDSLDNENHCTAGNDYLAEFCQCSERKISDSIKRLCELGYIEVVSFNGRVRTVRSLLRNIAPCSMQSRKICDAGSQNLRPNNIDNNIDNKDIIINDNTDEFDGHSYSKEELKSDFIGSISKQKKSTKGKNLYSKCMDEIDKFTDLPELKSVLVDYLNFRISVKEKPLYSVNQWKSMLKKLDKCVEECLCEYVDIVQQSLDKCWLTFYPKREYTKKPVDEVRPLSDNVCSEYGGVSSKRSEGDDVCDEQF